MKRVLTKLAVRLYYLFQTNYFNYIYSLYRQKYTLSKSFRFNGPGIRVLGDGEFVTGDDSYVSGYSSLYIEKGQSIRIGSNTRISHNVRLYTSSLMSDQDFTGSDLERSYGNIEIGDGVLIGVNSFIVPGITIGNNVIVGADPVVTHDLPDNAFIGVVPARIIRYKSLNSF